MMFDDMAHMHKLLRSGRCAPAGRFGFGAYS